MIAESAAGTALARRAWWLFITVTAVIIIITKCKRNGPVFGAIFAKNASSFSHYADARIFLAADAKWMRNPVGLANQHVQGMGARNDLKSVQN